LSSRHQLVLEQQRFLLTADDDRLERAEQPIEQRHERARVGRARVEIAAHPVREVDGLADVDDAARSILHQVHAGLVRQLGEPFFEFDRSHQLFSLVRLTRRRNEEGDRVTLPA
jgi:hypothetical protein